MQSCKKPLAVICFTMNFEHCMHNIHRAKHGNINASTPTKCCNHVLGSFTKFRNVEMYKQNIIVSTEEARANSKTSHESK